MKAVVGANPVSTGESVLFDYIALAKPRVASLVVLSSSVGFYLGHVGVFAIADVVRMLTMMLGTVLVVSAGNATNQIIERAHDAKMIRTANRPLASGRMQSAQAVSFSLVTLVSGLVILGFGNNVVSAVVALTAFLSYAFVYTPMKRVGPSAVMIGAVPGALPTVIGWSASTGGLELGAWLLFAIVFFWQLPHFQAIAWIYRDDYARAGFKVLPVVHPGGKRSMIEVVGFSLLLIPVTLLPTFFDLVGVVYYVCAMALGFAFLAYGLEMVRLRTHESAKQHMWASLAYLTLVFVLLIVDKSTA